MSDVSINQLILLVYSWSFFKICKNSEGLQTEGYWSQISGGQKD